MTDIKFSAEAAQMAEVMHLFHGKGYAKLMQLAKGEVAQAHKHNRDHTSMLLLGSVHVTVNGLSFAFRAPATITVKAGEMHEITALEDVLWACVWDNPEGLLTQTAFETSVIADEPIPETD